MVHVNGYLLAPVTSLARDAGVSHSAISPRSFRPGGPVFLAHLQAGTRPGKRLGEALPGGHLDPCELFSLDGTYPTASVCDLIGCPNRPKCWLSQAPSQRPQNSTEPSQLS